ncbi:MAG TPA: 50S ribosomal protein L28 [Acidimicrobiales bacterium]|nr:50S ribosomal protein L28 [Acidimicrobiales bacterium]
MGAVCEICGKRPRFGKRVSRLGKGAMHRRIKARTSRRFDPNIQRVRVLVNGGTRRMDVCTRCIHAGRVQKAPRRTREEG